MAVRLTGKRRGWSGSCSSLHGLATRRSGFEFRHGYDRPALNIFERCSITGAQICSFLVNWKTKTLKLLSYIMLVTLVTTLCLRQRSLKTRRRTVDIKMLNMFPQPTKTLYSSDDDSYNNNNNCNSTPTTYLLFVGWRRNNDVSRCWALSQWNTSYTEGAMVWGGVDGRVSKFQPKLNHRHKDAVWRCRFTKNVYWHLCCKQRAVLRCAPAYLLVENK